MMVKVIVFDFDGTLADTYHTFIDIANNLSGEFGYKPVNFEEQQQLKHLSAEDIIKKSEIPLLKIPFILKRIKSELNHKIKELKPIQNIPDSLNQLKNEGYSLGIITSNVEKNVRDFLESNELENLFDFVYSGTTLFGKHKIINKLLNTYQLIPGDVIYVGDETRDIHSAKKARVKTIAVGWGFNSPEILATYKPDFLINYPHQLIDVVEVCNQNFRQVL